MKWEPENADPAVGTFMPALRWVVERTDGPILELGGGYFSTPYLHEQTPERLVVTYEGWSSEWMKLLAQRFMSPRHVFISDMKDCLTYGWSVVLVDCEGWNRLPFFRLWKTIGDTFVIHDSQDPWIPEEELRGFEYRYDFDDNPRTTLLSRTLDVREFGRG